MEIFPLKIALLAPANSSHTIKWASGLTECGHSVHLISAHKASQDLPGNVRCYRLPIAAPLGYVLSAISLRKILKEIKPDILNAHYATGYGTLARLSGFRPLLLSVWGSDIYVFPKKSKIHRWLVRGKLRAATAIASTSECMATATRNIVRDRHIFVTPFGVDEKAFSPNVGDRYPHSNRLVIGTVKALSSHYGIDTLIEAFALARETIDNKIELTLDIYGSGPELLKLKSLCERLRLTHCVRFYGRVPHAKVPEILNGFDIFVALSRSESFGVAILEASASALPVVVSDAEGLAEVTLNEVTGLVVPKEDPFAAAQAIVHLVRSPDLCRKIGEAGRKHVLEKYSWTRSLELMIDAYIKTVAFQNDHDRGKSKWLK